MANNQGNILVTDQTLRDAATTFRANIAQMRSLLDESNQNVNSTSSTWQGEAAESLRTKYDKLKATFDTFCQNVEQFAVFLDKSAEEFIASEEAVKRAAEETIADINVG